MRVSRSAWHAVRGATPGLPSGPPALLRVRPVLPSAKQTLGREGHATTPARHRVPNTRQGLGCSPHAPTRTWHAVRNARHVPARTGHAPTNTRHRVPDARLAFARAQYGPANAGHAAPNTGLVLSRRRQATTRARLVLLNARHALLATTPQVRCGRHGASRTGHAPLPAALALGNAPGASISTGKWTGTGLLGAVRYASPGKRHRSRAR